MKTCKLHAEARPDLCHDCARDTKDLLVTKSRGPLRITEADRGKMRIELGTGRGNPTTIHWTTK